MNKYLLTFSISILVLNIIRIRRLLSLYESAGSINKEIKSEKPQHWWQQNNNNVHVHWPTDAVCHTPIESQIGAVPPKDNIKETRIINLGMPKSGSSSTRSFFTHSGFHTSHWFCGKKATRERFCGKCINFQVHSLQEKLRRKFTWKSSNLFQKCGDFHVWTQLDFHNKKKCYFPQIQYLEELFSNAPNATWLMPMRNVTAWVDSVGRWGNMREEFGKCDFRPHLNFKQRDAESDDKMMELYCSHIDQIREFVKTHPTLSYIEYRIEDPNVGSYLKEYFPSLSESNWGKENVNEGTKEH